MDQDIDKIEEKMDFTPRFNPQGLIPAIAQDIQTGEILMLAWMNEDALHLTLKTGQAHYWSRSRQEIWHKGATSGSIQYVKEIWVDCDQDALILRVTPEGAGACHTGRPTCFYRRIDMNNPARLQRLIHP
jgi:phosphoribosyl-AMP cyclohydrolase